MSTITNYTPGPWTASKDEPNFGDQIFIYGGDPEAGVLIARMNHVSTHGRAAPKDPAADAQLITAAPDLLKACNELLWVLSGAGPHRASSVRAATKDLRDAVAKASGK